MGDPNLISRMQAKATLLRATLRTLPSPVKSVKGLLNIHTLSKETKTAVSSLGLKPVYKKLDYPVLATIARGNFSNIYVVERGKGELKDEEPGSYQGSLFAAKVSLVDTSALAVAERRRGYGVLAADIHTIVQEAKILKQVQNVEHVVMLEELVFQVKKGDERMWMIMEYLPWSLSHFEGNLERKITLEEGAVIASGLIKALEHVHSKGFIHMDLKLENVLLSPSGFVKLCDFGSSVEFVKGKVKYVDNARGTPYAMALELWEEGEKYDERVDVWSLGVVVYSVTRTTPSKTHFTSMNTIRRGNLLRAYQRSNEAFFMSAFGRAIHDWENNKAEFAKLRGEKNTKWEQQLDLLYAHSVEYRELFDFCRRAVVPLPMGGCKGYEVNRKDELDRASLDELKKLPWVKDILPNESMQRNILQSLVQEANLTKS